MTIKKYLFSFALLAMINQGFASDFGFSDVEQKAKDLARHDYEGQKADLPQELDNLSFNDYSQIRYKSDQDIWTAEKLPFRLELLHRGYLYKNRLDINLIDDGKVSPVNYSADQFNFGNNKFTKPFPSDLGFAGFRIKYAFPHAKDPVNEVAVFLGASYFRAAGLNQNFGLSARALAIDTGLARPEEFPVFREFWVEKPSANAKTLTFYALLDSPSVTGAYRFVLRPGTELTFDVKSHVYMRDTVERFGVAPITSMFYFGKNREHFMDDYRPEVHDSDGLLVKKSLKEWLWRPLINPMQLGLSIIHEPNLSGFGLFQRERSADQYQDFAGNFQNRPSLWVEPLGQWAPGAVYLIEIPSDAEFYDNIAAFWVPDEAAKAGREFKFNYRLHFLLTQFAEQNLAKVIATRIGAGGAGGTDREQRRFVIDFATPDTQDSLDLAKIQPVVTSSAGDVQHVNVLQDPDKKIWRLVFELDPRGNQGPIELSAYLKSDKQKLTETWLYQWHK